MTTIGLLLLTTMLVTPASAGLDCEAVLARCQETPRRCQAGKLKRCLQQTLAVCTPTTTPTTTTTPQAPHCAFCPTAHCQEDGTTCEECKGLVSICDPDSGNACCRHPPLPIDCAPVTPEILPYVCGVSLPLEHGCCVHRCVPQP